MAQYQGGQLTPLGGHLAQPMEGTQEGMDSQSNTSAASFDLVPDSVELRVLTEFYHSTGGAGWTSKTNWLQGSTIAELDAWRGITVSNGDVTGIVLTNNGLSGPLPNSLTELAALQTLNLTNNSVTGTLPTGVGNLARLRVLNLWNNSLTGPIPPQLGGLASLEHLYLTLNNLSGGIPAELGNLTNLTDLGLFGNSLTGTIPPGLGQLTKLRVLDLQSNDLEGEVPASLGNLVNLEAFGLAGNLIGGALPAQVGGFPRLNTLVIQSNLLSSVPDFSQNPNRANLTLRVFGNRLDFGSIEPNMSGAGTHGFTSFSYSPQAVLGAADTVEVAAGETFSLSVETGGARNLYQWQRRLSGAWQDIAGATQSAYTVPSATAADAGLYRCRVTNEWATALTLHTAGTTVTVAGHPALVRLPPNLPVVGQECEQ